MDSIQDTAQQLARTADQVGIDMAYSALARCDRTFERTMTEGTALWVSEKCDPVAMEAIGHQSAALIKTGIRRALIESFSYLLILGTFGGVGLWLVNAPKWLYFAGVPVSGSIAIALTMSPDRKA